MQSHFDRHFDHRIGDRVSGYRDHLVDAHYHHPNANREIQDPKDDFRLDGCPHPLADHRLACHPLDDRLLVCHLPVARLLRDCSLAANRDRFSGQVHDPIGNLGYQKPLRQSVD
jgi:hypothetical protein